MKKVLIAALSALFLLGGCFGGAGSNTTSEVRGSIVILNSEKGKTEIGVEVADIRDERTKGLMYRKSLPEDQGMFFIFEKNKPLTFWMKNMLIPLDMVFFDHNYKVVKIVKNAQPCKKEPCESYPSEVPAIFVLELNAGTADDIKLKEGDKADLII